MFKKLVFLTMLVTLGAIFLFEKKLEAQSGCPGNNFPGGPGTDPIMSMGKFRIAVDPPFRNMAAALYPDINLDSCGVVGYNPGTKRLNSPVLFDNATMIDRGAPMLGPHAEDFQVVPSGFERTDRREVHTEIVALNLTGGGMTVTLSPNPNRKSKGEVQSKGGANDFPAESFFDVFVEVTLGPPIGVLENKDALIVLNRDLLCPTGLPPSVIYIHGESPAVPCYFQTAGSHPPTGTSWSAGERFGYLVLAGHGTDPTITSCKFADSVEGMAEMPIPPNIPALTTYGLIALALLLIATVLWLFWRKRAVAKGGLA